MPVHLLTILQCFFVDFLFQHAGDAGAATLRGVQLFQLFLQLGHLIVLDLGDAIELALRVCSSASKRRASIFFFSSLMRLMASRSLVQRERRR